MSKTPGTQGELTLQGLYLKFLEPNGCEIFKGNT